MSGAIILSMLLPCIPSLVAQYLGDILEIFIQMASFVVYKPGKNFLQSPLFMKVDAMNPLRPFFVLAEFYRK